jgi:hypothetical protein
MKKNEIFKFRYPKTWKTLIRNYKKEVTNSWNDIYQGFGQLQRLFHMHQPVHSWALLGYADQAYRKRR